MIPINRKLVRQSGSALRSAGRMREVIIELSPPGDRIGFRLKGTRKTYYLPVAECYTLAVLAHANAVRAAKAAARKTKGQAS